MNHAESVQMASFRSRDHFAVCALVFAVLAQLSRSGGNDARTGTAGRSYHDLPLGATLCPELDNALGLTSKPRNESWRVDETYIKIKGTWTYLYRAVDCEGTRWSFS